MAASSPAAAAFSTSFRASAMTAGASSGSEPKTSTNVLVYMGPSLFMAKLSSQLDISAMAFTPSA